MISSKMLCAAAASIAALALVAPAAAPEGWFLAGNKPANYDTGLDPKATFNDYPSAYLKSIADPAEGFGTLMQEFSASSYAGKRIRYSAYVQSQDVARWAGLWMRVDGAVPQGKAQPAVLAFDNMQNRPIKGSTGWQRYEIVLDVPDSAVNIGMGILLTGAGSVWLNSNVIEVVNQSVPTTGSIPSTPPAGPRNLSFQSK
jgi:hypothetical protein